MTTILDQIVAVKRQEIAAARQQRPLIELQAAMQDAPPVRDFRRALAAGGPIKLIAEIKKASPSKGVIRPDFQPLEIADIYQRNGATCLSVLTDRQFFQGGLRDPASGAPAGPPARAAQGLHPRSVPGARGPGGGSGRGAADRRVPGGRRAAAAARRHRHLGMAALVEFYEPRHLERILAAGATLIGINNRDLRTFATDLEHTIRLRPQIPADRVVVGESGIHTRDDACDSNGPASRPCWWARA